MGNYYSHKLSAERLRRCYEIAPPRVQRYLEAELNHVLQHIHSGDKVLELGCGYGRIMPELARKAALVVGIDTSIESVRMALEGPAHLPNCRLLVMDAVSLAFDGAVFDLVVCIQNGISAFHVDQERLMRESVRVTRPGGTVLFSSYSDRFWDDRLEWFKLQSEDGLVGEIDTEKTGDGNIVCKDGFTATTVRPHRFQALVEGLNVEMRIVEVDESSLFCEITPR